MVVKLNRKIANLFSLILGTSVLSETPIESLSADRDKANLKQSSRAWGPLLWKVPIITGLLLYSSAVYKPYLTGFSPRTNAFIL